MAKEIDLYARQKRLAWFLITPSVLVVLLIIAYPTIQVFIYSFMKYKLDGVTPPSFAGLDNYAFVFSDPDWWHAVWITVAFTIVSVVLESVLGLAIAMVANSKFKGRTFLRSPSWFPGPFRRLFHRKFGNGWSTIFMES